MRDIVSDADKLEMLGLQGIDRIVEFQMHKFPDSKSYELVNIDFNREQVDAKLKGKRVDVHSVLRKTYNFEEDKEIKNEDDSIDKRTGSFHSSNDYWKKVLVDIIEQSPRVADLIKSETLIYWRLSNHKANIFKIDESD